MAKIKKEIEVIVCDLCGEEIGFHRFPENQCLVCEKDICYKCNPLKGLLFQGYRVPLCPKHFLSLSLKEYVELAREQRKTR